MNAIWSKDHQSQDNPVMLTKQRQSVSLTVSFIPNRTIILFRRSSRYRSVNIRISWNTVDLTSQRHSPKMIRGKVLAYRPPDIFAMKAYFFAQLRAKEQVMLVELMIWHQIENAHNCCSKEISQLTKAPTEVFVCGGRKTGIITTCSGDEGDPQRRFYS